MQYCSNAIIYMCVVLAICISNCETSAVELAGYYGWDLSKGTSSKTAIRSDAIQCDENETSVYQNVSFRSTLGMLSVHGQYFAAPALQKILQGYGEYSESILHKNRILEILMFGNRMAKDYIDMDKYNTAFVSNIENRKLQQITIETRYANCVYQKFQPSAKLKQIVDNYIGTENCLLNENSHMNAFEDAAQSLVAEFGTHYVEHPGVGQIRTFRNNELLTESKGVIGGKFTPLTNALRQIQAGCTCHVFHAIEKPCVAYCNLEKAVEKRIQTKLMNTINMIYHKQRCMMDGCMDGAICTNGGLCKNVQQAVQVQFTGYQCENQTFDLKQPKMIIGTIKNRSSLIAPFTLPPNIWSMQNPDRYQSLVSTCNRQPRLAKCAEFSGLSTPVRAISRQQHGLLLNMTPVFGDYVTVRANLQPSAAPKWKNSKAEIQQRNIKLSIVINYHNNENATIMPLECDNIVKNTCSTCDVNVSQLVRDPSQISSIHIRKLVSFIECKHLPIWSKVDRKCSEHTLYEVDVDIDIRGFAVQIVEDPNAAYACPISTVPSSLQNATQTTLKHNMADLPKSNEQCNKTLTWNGYQNLLASSAPADALLGQSSYERNGLNAIYHGYLYVSKTGNYELLGSCGGICSVEISYNFSLTMNSESGKMRLSLYLQEGYHPFAAQHMSFNNEYYLHLALRHEHAHNNVVQLLDLRNFKVLPSPLLNTHAIDQQIFKLIELSIFEKGVLLNIEFPSSLFTNDYVAFHALLGYFKWLQNVGHNSMIDALDGLDHASSATFATQQTWWRVRERLGIYFTMLQSVPMRSSFAMVLQASNAEFKRRLTDRSVISELEINFMQKAKSAYLQHLTWHISLQDSLNKTREAVLALPKNHATDSSWYRNYIVEREYDLKKTSYGLSFKAFINLCLLWYLPPGIVVSDPLLGASVSMMHYQNVTDILKERKFDALKQYVTESQLSFHVQIAKHACPYDEDVANVAFCWLPTFASSIQVLISYGSSYQADLSRTSTTNLVTYIDKLQSLSQSYQGILATTEILENGIVSTVQKDLQRSFVSLSSHFQEVADFDIESLELQVAQTRRDILRYETSMHKMIPEAQEVLKSLISTAVKVSGGENAQHAGIAAASTVSMFVPTSWLGDPPPIALVTDFSAVAVGLVNLASTRVMGRRMQALTATLAKLDKNLVETSQLTDNIRNSILSVMKSGLNKDVLRANAKTFLDQYEKFDKPITSAEILFVETGFQSIASAACALIDGASTIPGAIVKSQVLEKCMASQEVFSRVFGEVKDMFEALFELTEKMALLVRAGVTHKSATILKNSIDDSTQPMETTLSLDAEVKPPKFFAQSALGLAVIQGEIQEVCMQICTMYRYQSGGTHIPICQDVIDSNVSFSEHDIALLIAAKMPEYTIVEKQVFIPTAPQFNGDTAFIDMQALASGNVVNFKPSPKASWLIDHEWIEQTTDMNNMIHFVSGFQLFMPVEADDSPVNIRTHVISSAFSPLKVDEVFSIPEQHYVSDYIENPWSCATGLQSHPYQQQCSKNEESSNICILSGMPTPKVEDKNTLYPSMLSEWSIHVQMREKDARILLPASKILLKANIRILRLSTNVVSKYSSLKNAKLLQPSHRKLRGQQCCPLGTYKRHPYKHECDHCPPNTTSKLNGYLCE